MLMLDDIFYKYSNMDSSSQILLFLIVLVSLMLISIFIMNIIIKKRNEKYDNKHNLISKYNRVMNTKKINKEEKKSNITKSEKKIIINKPEIKEEKQIISPKQEKIKEPEEIEVMNDEEVVEIISEESSIDKISTLLEDNINKPSTINLEKFEEDEEKEAIISYDELVRRAGAKKIIYKSKPATISEKVKEEKIEVKNEPQQSKFKASTIISPIYGRRKNVEQKKEELEEFIDLENIKTTNNEVEDEQLTKDLTFLSNLKTFRNNLD